MELYENMRKHIYTGRIDKFLVALTDPLTNGYCYLFMFIHIYMYVLANVNFYGGTCTYIFNSYVSALAFARTHDNQQ